MNNIPQERQEQILQWLREDRLLRIDELSQRLDVSYMTIHRDLDALVEMELVEKVHGGVRLLDPYRLTTDVCHLCQMPVQPRLRFVMTTPDGDSLRACCAHCGLLLLNTHAQFASALLRDFLHGKIINVLQAYFVVESRITTCCKPGVLAFADEIDAHDFQRGFGGEVMTYTQVREHLVHGHHCSHD
jgi:DNA-binding Lrp family transcriptional regulator